MTQLTEKQLPSKDAPTGSGEGGKPTVYDTAPPKALLDFMMTEWRAPDARLPKPIANARVHHARRRELSALFPGELLLVPTGQEKVRANDTLYRFRPGSDFFYLTGNVEPDCVLAMVPETAGGHRDVLFVEPNPGRSDATFYTDRAKGELWVGPRLGVQQSRARYGVHESRGLPELKPFLAEHAGGKLRLLRGHAPG